VADTLALSVTSRLPLSHALLEAVRRHEGIGINSESEMHNSTKAVVAISRFSDNPLLNKWFLASISLLQLFLTCTISLCAESSAVLKIKATKTQRASYF
jgi:hypothetical protein